LATQSSVSISVIYPGTFDPVTLGHLDIIKRATRLFDRVIVGVALSTPKKTVFSIDERVQMMREAIEDCNIRGNVVVDVIDGLLVNFAERHGARAIIRGLRAVSDFEYEFKMAWANRRMKPDIETIFLIPSEKYAYISSSLVREIARLGGDVSQFVTPKVKRRVLRAFSGKKYPFGE
jgi:pantetheine-phosphate adenylyltransferase